MTDSELLELFKRKITVNKTGDNRETRYYITTCERVTEEEYNAICDLLARKSPDLSESE